MMSSFDFAGLLKQIIKHNMATSLTSTVLPSSFPAPAQTQTIGIAGTPTDITCISFSDRLLITASQTGSLAHWVHVPLSASSDPMQAGRLESHETETALLPSTHLTATTVLGGTKPNEEVFGQTLATTIASSILLKRPNDERTLVLGLGLKDTASIGREGFDELIGALLSML